MEGVYQLVTINYMEEDWPDGYDNYFSALQKTIATGGIAYGAFHNDILVGYIAINNDVFGSTAKYVLLDSIFVSKEFRGRGIGKQLIQICIEIVKSWSIDKLYACASSAEDTIAFYEKMGWVDAGEINEELYNKDRRDIQLEYSIYNA